MQFQEAFTALKGLSIPLALQQEMITGRAKALGDIVQRELCSELFIRLTLLAGVAEATEECNIGH